MTSGASKQLDPDFLSISGNDNPANFCNGIGAYGDLTDFGTPGAPNVECP
ncbi:MAG: hypothetical protein ABI831_11370 [Betaproteobacteria bacterium]